MSNLAHSYPLDHDVFQGGRYLRAFDHAHDIDHFEHSLLTYLGSLMPFDKGFIEERAWPSVETISTCTKISPSTVRKKLRALEAKGYLTVETVRFLNKRGHFQQSTNNYRISDKAFCFFEHVLESRDNIVEICQRDQGDQFSWPRKKRSPAPDGGADVLPHTPLPPAANPNSSCNTSDDDDTVSPYYFSERDLNAMKAEVGRIIEAWEKLLNLPVTPADREKFLHEYVRTGGNEIHYSERVLQISADPYLTSRAKSINFLFKAFDAAVRNKEEIVEKAGRAIMNVQSETELTTLIGQIPDFIRRSSLNFGGTPEAMIKHLLQDPIASAKKRLGIEAEPRLPADARELRRELDILLASDLGESWKNEIAIIQLALERTNFGQCLKLYDRFKSRLQRAQKPTMVQIT